jgi:hypothetical protein
MVRAALDALYQLSLSQVAVHATIIRDALTLAFQCHNRYSAALRQCALRCPFIYAGMFEPNDI